MVSAQNTQNCPDSIAPSEGASNLNIPVLKSVAANVPGRNTNAKSVNAFISEPSRFAEEAMFLESLAIE